MINRENRSVNGGGVMLSNVKNSISKYEFMVILLLAVLWGVSLLIVACGPSPLQVEGKKGSTVTIIMQSTLVSGEGVPVVVTAGSGSDVDENVNGIYTMRGANGAPCNQKIVLKRGVGSCVVPVVAESSFVVTIDNCTGQRPVTVIEQREKVYHHGELSSGETIWDARGDHVIDGGLVVPSDASLHILEGARVLIGGEQNIVVHGTLTVAGSLSNPVVFAAMEPAASWGGVEIHGSRADFSYCFFLQGGGDPGKPFFHANCQPVLYSEEAEVSLRHCYFIDNKGKALGTVRSVVMLDRCHIARCASGGEFHYSVVEINHCHVADIPNDDGVFIDNDNDGFYFFNRHPDNRLPSRVIHTTIITGKDDAVDHNAAHLEIEGCWLEGFMHEGVAASEGDTVSVCNTVVKSCEQGIEAGYGSPLVIVDHSVVVENVVGLRFGDSYDLVCSGRMEVRNTIVCNNGDDVRNYSNGTAAAVENGITITSSIVNDTLAQTSGGCRYGQPVFDDTYHLADASLGSNAADDGTDMGLVQEKP